MSTNEPSLPRHRCFARQLTFACTGLVSALTANSLAAEPSELSPDIGYHRGEMETPRSAALGGGVRAASSSVEALYYNPAGMATARIYHFAGIAQIWPQARRQTYGAAAVDSVVNQQHIAGGASVNWTSQDPDGVDRKSFDFRFGLAAPLSERFFAGAALRYLTVSEDGYPRNDGLPPSVASGGLRNADIVADVTFDAGVTVKLTDEVSLAVVGQNLTNPGHGFLPLSIGGGGAFATDKFSLSLDAVTDLTTFDEASMSLMGGGEVLLGDSFPVRGGYRYDEGLGTQALSGGLGYVAPEFAIDASVRGLVEGGQSLTFVIGFRYHMEAAGVTSGF